MQDEKKNRSHVIVSITAWLHYGKGPQFCTLHTSANFSLCRYTSHALGKGCRVQGKLISVVPVLMLVVVEAENERITSPDMHQILCPISYMYAGIDPPDALLWVA